ncbi:MAG: hypothetical protein M0Z99_28645 [Betaproteobacteria bacterium]|nr:hypothetical protein [Betaproteobacteria bacterium]
MLDALFSFLVDVVAFYLGRFYLLILTLGRYKADIGGRNSMMVSLFGGVVTLLLFIGFFSWINKGA